MANEVQISTSDSQTCRDIRIHDTLARLGLRCGCCCYTTECPAHNNVYVYLVANVGWIVCFRRSDVLVQPTKSPITRPVTRTARAIVPVNRHGRRNLCAQRYCSPFPTLCLISKV